MWAISTANKYQCYVTVGYPETVAATASTPAKHFNSLVTISPTGQVLVNYRKRFLYYTDETWASEGDNENGFYSGDLEGVPVAMGICMDINPYKFTAPWEEYEFANHVVKAKAQLVIVSMAWLTRLSQLELEELPLRPDNDTMSYWIERFYPLQKTSGPVFLVLANRCGWERQACYAGTSSVICFREGRGYIYDMLGKYDEQCMVVDLQKVCWPRRSILPSSTLTSTGTKIRASN